MGAAIDTQYVCIDGLQIRYLDIGPTGDQPSGATLLVIPGHTARIEGFIEMLPILSASHRVLVLDLPGSGESDKPDRDYTLRFYEDTICSFLDTVCGKGPSACGARVVPMGGSLGGNLVLRLGHRFPERFGQLVVWAPGGAWKARPRVAAVTRRLGRRLFWPVVRVQSRYWYADSYPGREQALGDTFAYYRRVICPGFLRMYWGIAADQLAHSLFDIAPEIHQPTLLLWGDLDRGAGMGRGVARLHEMLPDNELHVFADTRHSIETERPHELARAIDTFVTGTATSE